VPLRPALIALQFLTRLPIRLQPPPAGREVGLSLLWYPVVGLLLGALLCTTGVLSRAIAPSLAAAMILSVWVVCTGAMHLEGLADTADAWAGGRGERERMLSIMKDPRSGPIAVVTVVCLLLLKFGALSALQEARPTLCWSELRLAYSYILPPVLARAAVPLLFAQTPYLRAHGLGADLAQYQSRAGGRRVTALTGLAAMVLVGPYGLLAGAAAAVVYLLMRRAFLRRLGGMTGDCAGALIEVIETVSLITLTNG
jgi:adenosylcobinamide-GDP ribazoletransferase